MLLKPKHKLNAITDITLQLLQSKGITCLILDVDNTLSTHHGTQLTNGLEDWIKNMRKNNIDLIILSNSKQQRVAPFAKKIGIDFISCALKPLPFGYLRALKSKNAVRSKAAIVGDQVFTDILGGNLVGISTILLTPILPEKGWTFRVKRHIEKMLFKLWRGF